MSEHPTAEGFFITGFPRDIIQAQGFEEKVNGIRFIDFNQ